MEQGGDGRDGESAAKRASLSSGDTDSAAAAGEDRLSALPDEILVFILCRLNTAAAARTSILSRRWRRFWALLPELSFVCVPDLQIRPVLEAHEAALLRLNVVTRDAAPDSVSAWLTVAARRLSGRLLFHNGVVGVRSAQGGDDEEAAQRGAFELPCLEQATDVSLYLGFLGLSVPPAGVFARLTRLCLTHELDVSDARGLDKLTIHSDSLRQVELSDVQGLRQLNIVAPALEDLKVADCFCDNGSQPVANITAPQLATLAWMDPYDPSSVHLGEMEHLRLLRPYFFLVYGDEDESSASNQYCLSLLQRFEVIECLILALAYERDIDDYDYMMEDMTMLPDIMILELHVLANGHAFGASAFHVLRMCSSIKKLMLSFLRPTEVEAQTTCPPGCICSEQENWETEHLLLNRLTEVEVTRMRGSEHEVTFVKQLFNWATSLEKMRVVFDKSVTESMAKELSQVLKSFARPGICMEIRMHIPED